MKNWQKIEDKDEVKKILDKALFKTFFHSLEWQEFLEKEFKWLKFEHYLYRPARPAGGDELLLSFARFKVFGKEKLISLPFCEYGGPLPLKENISFENFEKDVLEEFKNIKIKIHPQILNISTKRSGQPSEAVNHQTVSTHWIENLDRLTPEDLLKSFRKTLRHSIRNAEEKKLEIKKCSNISEFKKFYNLYVDNLKRRKTVPYPYSVVKFLYQNSDTEILLVLYQNKIIAGCLFLHYDKFIHYFLSANDFKYRGLGANYLILWEKIKKSLSRDYKVFDLGAAPRGSELEIFKNGWRGKEYPILQLGTKRSEESLRSSKLRNIWGLLPNFLIKKLSPYLIKYRI